MAGPRAGSSMPAGLDRVRQAAKRDKEMRFTALLHHITEESLRRSFLALKRQAAAGVDGVRWEDYERDLETRLGDLQGRIHRGAYRAKPSRRVYIPKADGRQRPLGIAALEDKIVQGAVVEVMNAIWEVEFLGFSYGFRPGRSQHDALDALTVGLRRRKVNWVLDADISDYFNRLDQDELMKFVERRIGDPRLLRLIRQWLEAGVVEEGEWTECEEGTPQGATISPVLANIYLHYVFDQWAERWRKERARGEVIIVRYADDFTVGFQDREEAERFHKELSERLAEFGLELKAEKTRLIEFGRYAARDRAARGLGKPETFDFLGFTHICGKTASGKFQVMRVTVKKRMRTKLKEIREKLRKMMHLPIPVMGRWLKAVVSGYLNYHYVPGNQRAMGQFRTQVERIWLWVLRRRSQRTTMTWTRMNRILKAYMPHSKVRHPYPEARFDARHPRQEPGAVVPLAGICAGGRP